MSLHFCKIQALLVELTGKPESAITPEASLGIDLGMDSLDAEEFSMMIEEEYGVRIDEKTYLGKLRHPEATVTDWTDYLDTVQ